MTFLEQYLSHCCELKQIFVCFSKLFFFWCGPFCKSLYQIFYNIASVLWFFCPWNMWDLLSLTRNWTLISCIGRQNLNHWTARETLATVFVWGKILWLYSTILYLRIKRIWQYSRNLLASLDFDSRSKGIIYLYTGIQVAEDTNNQIRSFILNNWRGGRYFNKERLGGFQRSCWWNAKSSLTIHTEASCFPLGYSIRDGEWKICWTGGATKRDYR